MENHKLNDQATEAQVEISINLLENSPEEDLDRTELDFLQQNEIINQELQKYDGQLSTCAMWIFKAWMSIYVILCSGFVLYNLKTLFSTLPEKSVLPWIRHLLQLINNFFLAISIYGFLLLWVALRSKDLFKVEKCLFILKFYLRWDILMVFWNFAVNFYQKDVDWEVLVLGSLAGLIFPVINLSIAMYVKKVLLKRNVFQEVSSTQ